MFPLLLLTSSFCAAVAAFINEEVAFVIDWADSRIKSSNVIFSRDT